jgi:DNA-binding NarL/FixJ family response regulator
MNSSSSIKIAIVDDQKLVRTGIAKLLSEFNEQFEIVFEAANGQEFLDLLEKHPVDIVLLDIEMPILNGVKTFRRITQDQIPVKVIMLSMHDDAEIAFKLLKEGVAAYLLKDCSTSEMVEALEKVYEQGKYLSPFAENAIFNGYDEQKKIESLKLQNALTERDLDVLMMICDGLKSEEIAPKISASKKTVDLTRTKLMRAFNVKTANALMRVCIIKGLYKPRTDDEIESGFSAVEDARRERRMARLRGEI